MIAAQTIRQAARSREMQSSTVCCLFRLASDTIELLSLTLTPHSHQPFPHSIAHFLGIQVEKLSILSDLFCDISSQRTKNENRVKKKGTGYVFQFFDLLYMVSSKSLNQQESKEISTFTKDAQRVK